MNPGEKSETTSVSFRVFEALPCNSCRKLHGLRTCSAEKVGHTINAVMNTSKNLSTAIIKQVPFVHRAPNI